MLTGGLVRWRERAGFDRVHWATGYFLVVCSDSACGILSTLDLLRLRTIADVVVVVVIVVDAVLSIFSIFNAALSD